MADRAPLRWRLAGVATVLASHAVNAAARLRPTRGRHHLNITPSRARWAATGAALAVLAGGGWWAVAPGSAAQLPATVASALPAPAPTAEQSAVFLAELAAAGVQLTPEEQAVAVAIGAEHVAHGHLIGMREPIRRDFRERIPRLTPEQVEIAKTAVEHHFLAVTGRKQ